MDYSGDDCVAAIVFEGGAEADDAELGSISSDLGVCGGYWAVAGSSGVGSVVY